MRNQRVAYLLCASCALFSAACSDSAGSSASNDPIGDAGADANDFAGTEELDVTVPASGRVYVNLTTPGAVAPSGDPTKSNAWDLAFEGYHVYTNSGPSGSAAGGAFGPLDPANFLTSVAPSVPFVSPDETGGAFLSWYAYDGTTHVLYSRFHVYGVRDGGRLWKVQVLTYYGTQDNAPTSGIYQIRYAEVTSSVGATQNLTVDGTAGGISAPETAPSGCLDLASGNVSMLSPSDALTSTAWDLCFRRDYISVNGGVSGSRGTGAVDLEANKTASEQLAQVEAETADGEQSLFDGVNASSFASATFEGDHVVSAFESGGWIDATQSPPALVPDQAWLVVDASGQHKFLVAFTAFQNPTTSSPGTVVMHIKPVSG